VSKIGVTCSILFLCVSILLAQDRSKIDEINSIHVQGATVSSDSLMTLFTKNLEDAKAIGYQAGVADGYSKLATIHYYQGDFEKATFYNLEAIAVLEELQDYGRVASSYAGLG
jgi:hypothetical protein